MNDTPRTDAIAHRGYNESAYIAEMTGLARELERQLEQERQDRKQAEADVCRALGERNDARAELASLKATIADPDEVELAMIRGEIAIPHRVGFDYIIGNP
jgi:hypothetical protein